MNSSRTRTCSFSSLLALCVLLLTICFAHIHQGNLAIDGIRYGAMSQEILASGNFFHIIDDYTGTEYANKSPALFWLVALSYRCFGVSTFSSKFPGACFAFLALLLLYRRSTSLFGSRAGFFSVFLFAGNVIFFRAVVDLNYEAMILVGVLLLVEPFLSTEQNHQFCLADFIWASMGLGLIMLAKPPYLLLLVPAFLSWFAAGGKFTHPLELSLFKKALLILPPCLGLSWIMFLPSSTVFHQTFENQLLEPLISARNFGTNLRSWLVLIGAYLAPLSLVGIFALRNLFSQTQREIPKRVKFFLLCWVLPAVPIIFFTESRVRYLLVPSLALAIIAGRYLAIKLPQLRERTFVFFSYTASLCILLLIFYFQVSFHPYNPLVEALQNDPLLLDEPPLLCLGEGKPGDIERPTQKRAELLLALQFQKNFLVYGAHDLPVATLSDGTKILADKKCERLLFERGVQIREERKFSRSALLEFKRDASSA